MHAIVCRCTKAGTFLSEGHLAVSQHIDVVACGSQTISHSVAGMLCMSLYNVPQLSAG